MRDTMGFMLRTVNADPENFTQNQWENAVSALHGYVSDGNVRSFNGNDYLNDLASGNTLACEAWSGDVIHRPGRQPGHQVRGARGGHVDTDQRRRTALQRLGHPKRPREQRIGHAGLGQLQCTTLEHGGRPCGAKPRLGGCRRPPPQVRAVAMRLAQRIARFFSRGRDAGQFSTERVTPCDNTIAPPLPLLTTWMVPPSWLGIVVPSRRSA